MHLLSIESSTKTVALAVSKAQQVLCEVSLEPGAPLETVLHDAIKRILKKAKIRLMDLDGFVVSLGPGSFTSLRVGLATLKAFCMATQKPLVGLSSLEVIAHGVKPCKVDQICVIMDARRSLVYHALYQLTPKGLKLKRKDMLTTIDDVLDHVHGKTLFVGDGVGLYGQHIEDAYAQCSNGCQAILADETQWMPRVSVLAQLGYQSHVNKDYADPVTVVPVYLYKDDCQVQPPVPKKLRRNVP